LKKVTYECDKCGATIRDAVYKLTCYAKPVIAPHIPDGDVIEQNNRQNAALQDHQSRHLCKTCKDIITDGLFIV
jgi:hypothetical protein